MMVKTKKKSSPGISVEKAAGNRAKGQRAILELDAVIYKKAALAVAQKSFAHLAKIEIVKKGNKQVIEFSGMKADVAKHLPDEFANFALGCLVVNR